jgi:hypothetical protein
MIYFEIIIRVYIDLYLDNKSYCLGKNLMEYLSINSILTEPNTKSISLKKRFWLNLLDNEKK